MLKAPQKKPSFIPPALASKDSATKGFTPPRFPVQPQAKPPSKATRAYSSDQRDLIQAKLLEGMDEAIQRKAQTEAIQSKCAKCEAEDGVQLKDDGESVQQKSPQDIAADGFTETPRQLPHLDKIQKSFGQDLSHVQAFIGGKATTASQQLGAVAYTSGNRIAFAKTPSLGLAAHEAAHEAAHVVQQQSGKVQLKDGLGQVGDRYEQHADAVADAVVAGKSAEPLLAEYTKSADPAPVSNKPSQVVQGKCSKCETHKDTLLQAKANQSQDKEFPSPISKAISIQYQVDSDKNSPKAETKQRSLSPACQNSLIQVGIGLGLVRRSQAAAPVLTQRALTAAGVSQVDTPAPGPADVAAIALFLWGLYEAGRIFFKPPDHCPQVAQSGIGSLIPSTGTLPSNNRPSTPSATSAPSLPSDEEFAVIAEYFRRNGTPYNSRENVRRIKQFLRLTPVDGNYGPTTARTVYLWQRDNGLTADGEVGPNTWSMMFPEVSPTTASSPSATSVSSLLSDEEFAVIAEHFRRNGAPYNSRENVRRIKQFLRLTPVDGNYGPTTARTVYLWQRDNGLTADGEVGPNTWSMMFPEVSPTTASSPSATSASSMPSDEDFAVIAQHFRRNGHPYNSRENVRRIKQFLGLTPVDGNYGPTTASTVYRWQRDNGLTPDGEVGPNTWSMMFPFVSPTTASSPSATSALSLPTNEEFAAIAEHFRRNGAPYNSRENVRRIKQFLGLTPVDGNYGPTTARTVYLWQQDNGLTPDGEVGLNTWSRMFPEIEPYQLTESTPPTETSLPASAIEGLRFLLQSLPPEIKEKLGGEANYLPLVDYYPQLARIAFLLLQLTPEQVASIEPLNLDPPSATDIEKFRKELEENLKLQIPEPRPNEPEPKIPTDELEPRRLRCGPDVTNKVKEALDSARNRFTELPLETQMGLCDSLTRPGQGDFAWEIVELHRGQLLKNNRQMFSAVIPPCATPGTACAESVEVNNECYYAGSVNYVVFGLMCKLCDEVGAKIYGLFPFSQLLMSLGIFAYKGPWWLPGIGRNPRYAPNGNYPNSQNWAKAGYTGWPGPNSSVPPADRQECNTDCPVPSPNERFTVKWRVPMTNTEEILEQLRILDRGRNQNNLLDDPNP